MKPPLWLTELHRQWQSARGGRLGASARVFSRGWDELLDSAGIKSAEDQATAGREALAFQRAGNLDLKTHRYRTYLIERITVPLESEAWLRELFGTVDAAQLQRRSLENVAAAKAVPHARYPQLWTQWCASLESAFTEGRSLRPLNWKQPEEVREMLSVIRKLTETEWTPGISIRTASVQVGLDSKGLEGRQGSVESALAALFGNATSLQSLGITGSASHVWLAGPLVLHFADGSSVDHAATHGRYSIDHVDLLRVKSLTTTAQRLLTVENQKATFKDLTAANTDRSTLIVASSFPTEALKMLLAALPASLPHYHFGDTDPSGWHILLKLREASPRPVLPSHMRWRAAPAPSPLTAHDLTLLPRLIEHPLLQDCRAELEMMLKQGDRGDFEQESLGMLRENWPFYSIEQTRQ